MQPTGTKLFSALWAFALVASLSGDLPHRASYAYWIGYAGTELSALIILCRPAAARWLTLSAASFLLMAWSQLPDLPNHRAVLSFVALMILTSPLNSTDQFRSRWGAIHRPLRILALIVYGFAVLAKLNTTYTSSLSSCAYVFFEQALAVTGFPLRAPSLAMAQSVAWWSIANEALIACLLIWRRTRLAAIILGVVFHLALATNYVRYFANFSSAMFLLLFSWLSPEQAEESYRRYGLFWRRILPAIGITLFTVTILTWSGVIEISAWMPLRHAIFCLFGIGLLASLLSTVCASHEIRAASPLPPLSIAQAVLLALSVGNGAAPYLGIKTRSSLSMYSNLRVEPQVSNHFFMPPSPDLLGVLKDTVQITSGDLGPEASTRCQEAGCRFTYLEFCSRVAQRMDEGAAPEVSYIRGATQHQLHSGGSLPGDCPVWIARKLLLFGPVGPGSEDICAW